MRLETCRTRLQLTRQSANGNGTAGEGLIEKGHFHSALADRHGVGERYTGKIERGSGLRPAQTRRINERQQGQEERRRINPRAEDCLLFRETRCILYIYKLPLEKRKPNI